MNLTDYEFYQNTYKGFKTPSSTFDYYSLQASDEIIANISGYTDEDLDTDNMKKCACAVTDLLYEYDNKKELDSETVGPYTRKFAKQQTSKSPEANVYQIMVKYLGDTGLMNRGVLSVH